MINYLKQIEINYLLNFVGILIMKYFMIIEIE